MSKFALDAKDEEHLRNILATYVATLLSKLEGTQKEIGERLGLDQAEISALKNARFDRFSTERLIRSLRKMGCDIELSVIRPENGQHAGGITIKVG